MKRLRTIILGSALFAGATLGLMGCTSGDKPLQPNSGKSIDSTPGQTLTEAMFLGKWDIDGERTNTANGHGSVAAIPADITRDILGKGWRFEPHGDLKVDQAVGWKTGSWKLSGDSLTVDEGKGPHTYTAQFKDGYLYLKTADGKTLVFERDKFFGT